MGMFGATYSNELFVDEDNCCEIGEMILDITLNGFVFDITSDGSDHTQVIISGPRKKLEPFIKEYFGSDQVALIED
jgi:hypothetical protein